MLGLLLLALVPSTVSAHETEGVLDVTPATVEAGTRLRVAGGEATPREAVSVLVFGAVGQRRVGNAAADDHGDFAADLVLPSDLPAGAYTVRAFGRLGTLGEAAITVTPGRGTFGVAALALAAAAGVAGLALLAAIALRRRRVVPRRTTRNKSGRTARRP